MKFSKLINLIKSLVEYKTKKIFFWTNHVMENQFRDPFMKNQN